MTRVTRYGLFDLLGKGIDVSSVAIPMCDVAATDMPQSAALLQLRDLHDRVSAILCCDLDDAAMAEAGALLDVARALAVDVS